MRTKIAIAVLLGLLVAGATETALAHGDPKPQYGGIVQSAGDISYELAPNEQGSVLYVDDHGNPVLTAGITGFLAVMSAGRRADYELKPIGENRMLAIGAKLTAGQRATAVLKLPSGQSVVVQFPAR